MKVEMTAEEKAKIIGERIYKLRTERKLERKDVASGTNLTISAISNYELGIRVPRDEAKVALARFFGVDVATFFCLETTQNV